jgi:signal transduction histidine kinase
MNDMNRPNGSAGISPYTPATVETGMPGARPNGEIDSLYAEAKQLLGHSSNQLKDVSERLRQAYGEHEQQLSAAGDDASRRELERKVGEERALAARIALVCADLEQDWRFLERGSRGPWNETQRASADDPADGDRSGIAMQLLEAREQERAAVASELHDGPAQAMTNAIFQVDVIDRTLRTDPATARLELMTLRGELDRELDRLRGFIHQLHPSMQGDDSLEQAIGEIVQRMHRDNGLEVDVHLDAPEELLDVPRRRAVLRVAQESLRNARKHAAATRVRLATFMVPVTENGATDPQWVLEISDNGHGFHVEEVLDQSSKRHFGLRFMRERAQLIGARLDIISNATSGTTVRLALDPAKRS